MSGCRLPHSLPLADLSWRESEPPHETARRGVLLVARRAQPPEWIVYRVSDVITDISLTFVTTGANEAAQLGEDITRRLVPWGEPERVPADGTGLLSWPRGEVSAEVAVHTDLEPYGLTVSIAQPPSRT